ncbi:MAG: hypothetical protein QHH24_00715 [Candidatus Bathyarchaeota archaeon]|nr:hypothetical protein [Candidatus Bathyarchaeota archaeon]
MTRKARVELGRRIDVPKLQKHDSVETMARWAEQRVEIAGAFSESLDSFRDHAVRTGQKRANAIMFAANKVQSIR